MPDPIAVLRMWVAVVQEYQPEGPDVFKEWVPIGNNTRAAWRASLQILEAMDAKEAKPDA